MSEYLKLTDGVARSSQIVSGDINYTNPGTGAVTRTVQAWIGDQYVSVKDFGATGNGSTDDTTAIQAALTALSSGGTVYFPAGTYIVSSSLTPSNGTCFLGVGSSSVISTKNGALAAVGNGIISGNNLSNIKISNLKFNGGGSWTSTPFANPAGGGNSVGFTNSDHAILLTYSATGVINIEVSDCEFTGYNSGIYVSGDNSGSSFSTILAVRGCYFHNLGLGAVNAYYCDTVHYTNNRIVGVFGNITAAGDTSIADSQYADGLYIGSCINALIQGNYVENFARSGIIVEPDGSVNSQNISIANNVINLGQVARGGEISSGIYIGDGFVDQPVVVSDNVIYNVNAYGIVAETASIIGGSIYDCGSAGINWAQGNLYISGVDLQTNLFGITASNTPAGTNITIKNCNISNNTSCGIQLFECKGYIDIIGNYIQDNGSVSNVHIGAYSGIMIDQYYNAQTVNINGNTFVSSANQTATTGQLYAIQGEAGGDFSYSTQYIENNIFLFTGTFSSSYPSNLGITPCSFAYNDTSTIHPYEIVATAGNQNSKAPLLTTGQQAGYTSGFARLLGYASSAPVSGSYLTGDHFINESIASGQPFMFMCVSSGTPGTWEDWGGNASVAVTSITGDVTGTGPGATATTAAATQNNITSIPNLATVGTIGTGTWNGTAIAIAHGGTNAVSATNGSIPNATSATASSWTATPQLGIAGTTTGSIAFGNSSSGSSSDLITLSPGVQTGAHTLTMPVLTGADTLATLGLSQTFSAATTFSASGTAVTISNSAIIANGGAGSLQVGTNATSTGRIVLGTLSNTPGAIIDIGNTGPGQTSEVAVRAEPTFSTSVTGTVASFVSAPTTGASTTVSTAFAFESRLFSTGASATITTGVDFYSDQISTSKPSAISATNTAVLADTTSGFSGSNFIYQSTTAPSTFGGDVTFAGSGTAANISSSNSGTPLTLQVNNTSSTANGISQLKLLNDASRAFEFQYYSSGTTAQEITNGPSGEQGVIVTSGAFPICIATNGSAAININSSQALTLPATGTALTVTNNATIGGTLTLTPITSGSVLYAGTSGLVSQDNSNFFWDDTNLGLRVGTNATIGTGKEALSAVLALSSVPLATSEAINISSKLTSTSVNTVSFSGLRLLAERSSTTSVTDTGGLFGAIASLVFDIASGQTLTVPTSVSSTPSGIRISSSSITSGGSLTGNYIGLNIASDTTTMSGTKVSTFLGGISGGTNNAFIADNLTFSGSFFINQSGSAASTFGGDVTLAGSSTGLTVTNSAIVANGGSGSLQVGTTTGSTGRIVMGSLSNTAGAIVDIGASGPGQPTEVGVKSEPTFSSTATTGEYAFIAAPSTANFGSATPVSNVGNFYSRLFAAGTNATITRGVDFLTDQTSSSVPSAITATYTAVLADNQSFTNNWFINQNTTANSILGGYLSVAKGIVTPNTTNSSTTTPINDLALNSWTRLTGAATITLNGIAAGTDGQQIFLTNLTGNTLTITNQSGSATGAEIVCPSAANQSLHNDATATFIYDGTSTVWRLVSYF